MAETASLIIKVDSSGADRATRSLSNLDKAAGGSERAANKLGKAWGVAAGAIAAAGVGVATAALFKLTRNTIEAEQQLAQLNAVLRSTGEAAGYSSAQMVAMAEGFAKATTHSTGEIIEAQTRLLSYSGIVGEQFPRALQLAIDQSVRLGENILQSAETVGKALEYPAEGVAALTKQGFRFTEEQKKMLKVLEETGRLAEAQAIVMEVMEESYRGAAQAARDTLGGALKGLSNAFNDLMTGDAGGAGIQGVTKAINDLTSTMQSPETKAGVASLIAGIVDIAAGIVDAIPKIVAFNDELKKSFGLAGEAGKRRATLGDVFSGGKQATGALMRWDRDGVNAGTARLRAGALNFFTGGKRTVNDFSGVTSSVEQQSKARWGGVTSSVDGTWNKPTPSADSVEPIIARTRATQELTEAQKAWFALEQEILDHEDLANAARTDYTNEQIRRANRLEDEAERQHQATDALIEDMQFELSLIGMSNAEREREIALRHAGAGATDEQRRAIADLIDKIGKAREADGYVQDMKSGLGDLFSAIGQGSDAATASIDRMFENLKRRATQALADRAIEGLIQGFAGMAGGGGWAGFASGFGKGFTGRATGGPVSRGGLYEVGEGGRSELLQSGGKTYLIPGTSGTVIPATNGGKPGVAGSGMKVEINNYGNDEVKTREETRQMPDGSTLRKMIIDVVADDVASGGRVVAAGKSRLGWREAF